MTGGIEWPFFLLVCAAVTVGAVAMIWLDDRFRKARHAKDNELQELQSQIDVLQLQVRELQIACKGLNGNHFTRTPNH